MKTIYQILQETIETSRKLGVLDTDEKKLRHQYGAFEREAPRENACVEEQLDTQSRNHRMEKEQISKMHELEMEMLNCSEKLNTFLWLFEDDKGGNQ